MTQNQRSFGAKLKNKHGDAKNESMQTVKCIGKSKSPKMSSGLA